MAPPEPTHKVTIEVEDLRTGEVRRLVVPAALDVICESRPVYRDPRRREMLGVSEMVASDLTVRLRALPDGGVGSIYEVHMKEVGDGG